MVARAAPAVASVTVAPAGSVMGRRRAAVRERVLDGLGAFPAELDRVNVDFVEGGGAVVSMHGHRLASVDALLSLLGVEDDAPVVRVVDAPFGSYEVIAYAEHAEVHGGIALDWYPEPTRPKRASRTLPRQSPGRRGPGGGPR